MILCGFDSRCPHHLFNDGNNPSFGGNPFALLKILRSLDDLIDHGLVPKASAATLAPVAERYAIGITDAMAQLVDPSDSMDPIALQFVPDLRELVTTLDERDDPIGDEVHSPGSGAFEARSYLPGLLPVLLSPRDGGAG